MEEIDWSKAPEGTEYYLPEGRYIQAWVKRHGESKLLGILDNGADDTWGYVGEWLDKKYLLIQRPSPSWNGTGLPPVGTVCTFHSADIEATAFHKELRNDVEVEVIAHFYVNERAVAAFVFDIIGGRQVEQAVSGCFTPIRAPEQIAADEHEAEIKGIEQQLKTIPTHDWYGIAKFLYESGYRKQEQPE